jgi:protein-S-isoprenylcysteine O-methyltransferase Ste14
MPDLLHQLVPWIITLCAAAVLSAVALNFLFAGASGEARAVQRSPVATLSMVVFFTGVYGLIHYRIGAVAIPWPTLRAGLSLPGALLVVAGCAVNLAGRFSLGANWADQVTLYASQQLVTRGVYALVRHPLYASLIWMFCGAGLAYANIAVLAATALLFIPAMYYRAAQEERALARAFPEYADYRRRVGMLFPRLPQRRQHQR